MGDLTKNFSLDEFLVSSTADAHGIANTPPPGHLKRIRETLAPGMQLVRDILGRAMVITSAYRNEKVNRLVGGVRFSDHTEAWASDFRTAGLSAYATAKLLQADMLPGGRLDGKIDQLILETSRSIVHISFSPRRRGQCLTQRHGAGTPFEQGIVA